MKECFHLTLMISTHLYLAGLLNGEYFWYYICRDGKTTYMNECNQFIILWTQSSLESISECWILHLDCWVSWNTCNITSRHWAPYWLWAEQGCCALFQLGCELACTHEMKCCTAIFSLQGMWINDVWSFQPLLTGKLRPLSRIQE